MAPSRVLVAVLLLVLPSAACGDDDTADPEITQAATETGELVGSSLAKAVSSLRVAIAADPGLAPGEAFDQVTGKGQLSRARDEVDDMLALEGLDFPEMLFLFSEGIARRLPPTDAVKVLPNERPDVENLRDPGARRDVLRDYGHWAVMRAILVDDGGAEPLTKLYNATGPPAKLVTSAGAVILAPALTERRGELDSWFGENPKLSELMELLLAGLDLR